MSDDRTGAPAPPGAPPVDPMGERPDLDGRGATPTAVEPAAAVGPDAEPAVRDVRTPASARVDQQGGRDAPSGPTAVHHAPSPPAEDASSPPAGSADVPARDASPSGDGDRTTVLPSSGHGSLPPRPAPSRPGAARPGPQPPARPPARPDPRGQKPGRRTARLSVKRLDLVSVFTTSLALSILLGIVLVVAFVVLYGVLDSVGALGSVNNALVEINLSELPSRGDITRYALLLAAVDVVLVTVLATLLAGLYNLVSSFTGGVQVTLVDD